MPRDFDFEERKSWREERKRATARDRSKYKKTDQDQLKKQHALREVPENLVRGRVLNIAPDGITVENDGNFFTCTLKGSLKQDKNRSKNLIAVGDFVRFIPEGERQGLIALIEERHSILSRADHLSRRKQQLIAVNIDQVLITASVVAPTFKPTLLDRYMIAARKGDMHSLIVINKIDLLSTPSATDKEKQIYAEFMRAYSALDIPIFPVSTYTQEGLDALKEALQGKTSVFSGQSGVGKSSLINAIFGTDLTTSPLVQKTGKGAHVTTSAKLLPIEGGGFCIDTPGIKSFGLWDISAQEIRDHFTEFLLFSTACKFPNCSHREEPECGVKQALEKQLISPLRFASYCALMDLMEDDAHR